MTLLTKAALALSLVLLCSVDVRAEDMCLRCAPDKSLNLILWN